MAEWSFPQISEDGQDVSVDVDGVSVDVSDISTPSDVEIIQESVSQGVFLDVSGDDITGITMSFEDFLEFIDKTDSSLSENDMGISGNDSDLSGNDYDISANDVFPVMVLADTSVSSFTPQTWQLNMAQNRPVGWHYIMSRTGTNNNYILVLGRDISYSDGLYRYVDCDYYSVYQYSSSGYTNYIYDVSNDVTGTINSSSYVVYSDLFFDYVGGRSVSYSWFILAFIVIILLFLLFFRGNRK